MVNIKIITIIIVVIVIGISLFILSNVEGFGDYLDVRKDNVDYVDITKQFPDIKTFSNDSDFRMGLDKCIEYKEQQKGGNCVEYGITGNAWYYPPVKYDFSEFREKSKTSNQTKGINDKDITDPRNLDDPINYKYKFIFR